jgi:hypothetical protein
LPLKVWRVASLPSIGGRTSTFSRLRFHFGMLLKSDSRPNTASGGCFSVIVRVFVWLAGW